MSEGQTQGDSQQRESSREAAALTPTLSQGERGNSEECPLPLQGIRVADFGWVWAGAVLGQVLADMGAEVIKIESRKRLDGMRMGRPLIGDQPDPEQQPMFHNINRNKLSLEIDIKHPEGKQIILELVSKSDVAIENMSYGAMQKAGLDYESLRQVRPDLVMVSLAAVGQTGPLKRIGTYGPQISGLAGLDGMVGYEGERVLGLQHAYADPNASIHGAFAVLAALWYRKRTGKGQYIDLSQWEATTAVLGEPMMDYLMNGRVQGTQGNTHPAMAPHGLYPCKGDDKWVSIAVQTEEEWTALRRALGDPAWAADPAFADLASRRRNRVRLDKLVGEWTSGLTTEEAVATLQAAGVAAAPCLDTGERVFDPHFVEREVHVEVEHPILGSEMIYGVPWKMERTPGSVARRAPMLGEHNHYVLGVILGKTDEEIAELEREKVLY